MYIKVTRSMFHDAFHASGRGSQFSYEGLNALYDDQCQLEEECGEQPGEFDVIGLCCAFSEYADLEEFHGDYNKEEYPDMETLRDNTHVIDIESSDGFIIQQF